MSAEDISASKMEQSDEHCHSTSAVSSSPKATIAATSQIPSEHANTTAAIFKMDDYECMLCLRLLYEPTTLKCGHSFCRTCVEELYQQNHAKCPTCRQVLPIVHHYSSESTMRMIQPSFTLCKFLEAAFAAQYEERRQEIIEMYPSRQVTMVGSSPHATTTSATAEVAPATTPLPLFYLDPMVPRQVMQLNIFEHRYLLMVSRCLEGSRHFGMVGYMSRRMIAERRRRRMMRQQEQEANSMGTSSNNTSVNPPDHEDDDDDDEALSMAYGVEVEIVESSPQPTGTMHIQVKAKRRFQIVGDTWRQDGYTMGNVKWLSLPDNVEAAEEQACTNEEEAETQDETSSSNSPLSESETTPTSPAADLSENDTNQDDNTRAIQMAQTLGPLVEEWKSLVVAEGWQRYHGQLAQTINTIGPMPDANTLQGAVDRALWITALINPLPGMGVAPEIRPDVLETAAPSDGNYVPLLLVVTHGMRKSIEYLTPNAVVVWMQYQLSKLYCLLIGRGTRRLGPSPPLPGTHQMINALLRLLVVCLVLGFFWQRILTPKTASSSGLSSSASPVEVVLSAATATASPSMDTEL